MSMYKGHFNPSLVLTVVDVTIIAQLASGTAAIIFLYIYLYIIIINIYILLW